jgi:hypothetical protein
MTRRLRWLGFPWCVLLACAACAGAPVQQATATERDVVIDAGSSQQVPGTDVVIRFERVLADSRCPRDVQCIAAGDATVAITAAAGSAAPTRYELHTNEGTREATHERVRITVVDLAPVPESTRQIAPTDYKLTLHLAPM